MNLEGKTIAFGLNNVFYAFKNTIEEIRKIIKSGANVIPIMQIEKEDKYKILIEEIEKITGKKIVSTEDEVEKIEADILVISPCSRKYYIKTCNSYIWYTYSKFS